MTFSKLISDSTGLHVKRAYTSLGTSCHNVYTKFMRLESNAWEDNNRICNRGSTYVFWMCNIWHVVGLGVWSSSPPSNKQGFPRMMHRLCMYTITIDSIFSSVKNFDPEWSNSTHRVWMNSCPDWYPGHCMWNLSLISSGNAHAHLNIGNLF